MTQLHGEREQEAGVGDAKYRGPLFPGMRGPGTSPRAEIPADLPASHDSEAAVATAAVRARPGGAQESGRDRARTPGHARASTAKRLSGLASIWQPGWLHDDGFTMTTDVGARVAVDVDDDERRRTR